MALQPISPQSRLADLRHVMKTHGVDAYLIPMADEFQSEYVPASAKRIEAVCGFTGSAAYLIVLADSAVFFTDGRYTLQARQQLDETLFKLYDIADTTPSKWLADAMKTGQVIGYDPWLHTADEVERLVKVLDKVGAKLSPFAKNFVDAIWHDRPAPPTAEVEAYDTTYAGRSAEQKRADIATDLKRKGVGAALITDPASVAWLLNIRGGDTPNTPLALSYALLDDEGRVEWFIDPAKGADRLRAHLGPSVRVRPIEDVLPALQGYAGAGKPIRIDPMEAPAKLVDCLRQAGAKIDAGEDPTLLPRAMKNEVELMGMRAAHRRDGAALVRFFAWLEQAAVSGEVTELSAEEKLAGFRGENNLYRGPSFDTIAGAGSHGAIVHYRATATTNRKLELGQLFLLDSGGQYLDGTTDVTRAVVLGAPTSEMRERYTRVLKGHIALASIRFPEGTTGGELDALARQYLWAAGLDFAHGTGHGVGCYLGVHEGPQGISRRSRVPLKPGMILSNEPGYYKSGAYGIRIENLQAVHDARAIDGGERAMMGFEVLTLCPYDRRLIDTSLLTIDEKKWVDAYHARVREVLAPMLDAATADWLDAATAPL